MNAKLIAEALKQAFFEGFSSFQTACIPHISVEAAWEDSLAKMNHDLILGRAAPVLERRR